MRLAAFSGDVGRRALVTLDRRARPVSGAVGNDAYTEQMSIQRVLIAVDGSEMSTRAVGVGVTLASALGAQVAMVHAVNVTGAVAVEGGPPAAEMRQILLDDGKGILAQAAKDAPGVAVVHQFLREGAPGAEVCASAREWGADLIVIGTHGRGGLSRLLMGSTAEAVVRHAPCPVLVVPATAAART